MQLTRGPNLRDTLRPAAHTEVAPTRNGWSRLSGVCTALVPGRSARSTSSHRRRSSDSRSAGGAAGGRRSSSTHPDPVVYRCRRIGRNGEPFEMLKFRKMLRDAHGSALTAVDDERFTPIGQFLAVSRLDELPQLYNVLKGEMRLVGPRPETEEFVLAYPEQYREILSVSPGLTGLAQLRFAGEAHLLEGVEDRAQRYREHILPGKVNIDLAYVRDGTHAYRPKDPCRHGGAAARDPRPGPPRGGRADSAERGSPRWHLSRRVIALHERIHGSSLSVTARADCARPRRRRASQRAPGALAGRTHCFPPARPRRPPRQSGRLLDRVGAGSAVTGHDAGRSEAVLGLEGACGVAVGFRRARRGRGRAVVGNGRLATLTPSAAIARPGVIPRTGERNLIDRSRRAIGCRIRAAWILGCGASG